MVHFGLVMFIMELGLINGTARFLVQLRYSYSEPIGTLWSGLTSNGTVTVT